MTKKLYLRPKAVRRGHPVMHFIDRDDHGYWLGTYHTPQFIHVVGKFHATGEPGDYTAVSRVAISADCYAALKAEASRNTTRYKVRPVPAEAKLLG